MAFSLARAKAASQSPRRFLENTVSLTLNLPCFGQSKPAASPTLGSGAHSASQIGHWTMSSMPAVHTLSELEVNVPVRGNPPTDHRASLAVLDHPIWR